MPHPPAAAVTPALLIVNGEGAGRRFTVLPGSWTVGRDRLCDLTLDDPGVSRRHAWITNSGGSLWVEDAGSSNGTWLDGERLTGRRALSHGQSVEIGGILLRLEGVPTPATPGGSRRPPRRVSIIRVAFIGAVASSVLLGVGVLIQLFTEWTGGGAWLAAPLGGMAASFVEMGKEALTRPRPAARGVPSEPVVGVEPGSEPEPRVWAAQEARDRRRAPIGAGLLVVVLVVGGGGLALTYGVARLSSFITGNQAGTERLLAPVPKTAKGVTVSVQSVEQTRDFTRVTVSVRNALPHTITLPLYKNATLRDSEGTTLEADPFRSSWSDTIGPGQIAKGALVFPGHLPDAETQGTFAFATVFGQGLDGPRSIVVDDLVLEPFT